MFLSIKRTLGLLEKKELRFFSLLVVLMFFAMIFEVLSLGSLIPIINFFTESNLLPNLNDKINLTLNKFGYSKDTILSTLIIFVFFIFLIKNLYLMIFHWVETKIIVYFRANLSSRLFKKYINEDYKYHLEKNSYEISANIIQETAIFGSLFLFLSVFLTETLLAIGMIVLLYILNPAVTLVLMSIVILLSLIFFLFFKKKIKNLSINRKLKEKDKQNILQQGLSALKEIIIFKAQDFFEKKYNKEALEVASIHQQFAFISRLPRLWFEIFSIILVSVLIFSKDFLNINDKELLGFISLVILSLIKLLPSAYKIINSIQYINFSKQAVLNLHNEFKSYRKQPTKKIDNLNFNNSILIENLFFKIPESNLSILEDINFSIRKNDKIGIMGETGSGKSTLINIIAGLIKPTSGAIKIDGKILENNKYEWLNKIGYVGQSTNLVEGTVYNNIAFGIYDKNIDRKKVDQVAELSGLKDFINRSEGLNYEILENGKNLSGGEKQRIAIARVLYKDPEVIIFDESTSALDLDTEKKIISSIQEISKNRTIIFVSHKKSALVFCNKVYSLNQKKLELINEN